MKLKMMKRLLAIAAMLPMMLALSACGKKDEGGTVAVVPAPVAPVVGYYQANGQCYQANTTTVVLFSLCTNTGYYSSNGICYQTSTNAVVSSTLCPNIGTSFPGNFPSGGNYPISQLPIDYYPGTGGNLGGQVGGYGGTCQGWFFQVGVGWGICNGYNCHAMVLYNSQGQAVYCP